MLRKFLLVLLRRVAVAVPILLVVSVLLFCILRLLPIDPAAMSMAPGATLEDIAAKRREMGLDRPLPEQYAIWASQTLHGNFGKSTHFGRDVGGLVMEALPATIELALFAMLIGTILGVGGGLLLFQARGHRVEALGDLGATLTMSLPDFLWGLLLILLLGVLLPVLPFVGRQGSGFSPPHITGFLTLDALLAGRFDIFVDAVRHMILPALALGISSAPPIMRVLRSGLIDVYQEDYIRMARLRGLGDGRILLHHALKNAFLPTLTLMGVQFGFLFGGSVLVEIIFSYPGLGNLTVDAVRNADLPIIQIVGLTYCVLVLGINTLVDGVYVFLNPRLSVS
jgi:ABC-type dipeptide/oligopeptide/nickel transport system permease component